MQEPPRTSLEDLEADLVALAQDLSCGLERWLELVARFDAGQGAARWGFRGTAEWLSWRCGLDVRTARDHVRVARRLGALPLVRAAFASGELSYSKVRAVTRAAESEDEAGLLDLARRSTAGQLDRAVRSLRTAPSASLDVANRAHEQRRMDWWWDADGSLRFQGRLGADEGAALIEALETAAEALHPPSPDVESVQARPPLGARRVDALTEIVLSGAPRTQVVLHVDTDALACTATGDEPRAGEVCALQDGPAVASETARRLACDADVVGDHGRRRRVVSPALRTSLERRDGRCRFPDCTRRHGLHAHHIEHWAHGGRTDRDNLVMLCRFHHRLVHEAGFSVGIEAGERAFRRPDGRLIADVAWGSVAADRAPPELVAA